MSMSTRLENYLSDRNIQYQLIEHEHSNSSIGSAITAAVAPHQLAKAVILKNHEDRKLMAILPANRKISMSSLNEQLMGSYHLLKESEVYSMFNDCENGAIPPVAEAFNITSICDVQLDRPSEVYLEAGDHEHLIKVKHDEFEKLVDSCMHLSFSHEVFH